MKSLFVGIFFLLSFQSLAKTYNDFANSHFRKIDNTITVHVIPSTYPLEWTTPRSLLWSILKNQYWFPKTHHSIGHVTVEANCTIEGKRISKFMGQTTYSLDGFQKKIKEGYGFSILNRPNLYPKFPLVTVPGKLDDHKVMEKEFTHYIEEEHFALLSYKVSEQSCLNVLGFLNEYEKSTNETKKYAPAKRKAGNVYGFGADPDTFQGAGCAPFVESVLNIAGLHGPAHMMEQVVYLNPSLVGDPKNNNRVGISSILFNNENMSEKDDAGLKFRFNFPDPQNLYDHAGSIGSGLKPSVLPLIEKKKIFGKNSWYILQNASNK